MRRLLLNLLVIITPLLWFISCLETDIIAENKNNEVIETKIPDYTEAQIMLQIVNNANNIKLIIDSCYLYNIYGKIDKSEDIANMYLSSNLINIMAFNSSNTLFMGDTLISNPFYVSPQNIKKWEPILIPSDTNTYVKVYGKIITKLNNNTDFEIYSGEIFIPVSGKILALHKNIFNLTLENQAPWYVFTGDSIMTKVLVEIQFSPYIKDWEEIENELIIQE